jgi:cell division protein FtsW (lipid II flippase)
MAVSYTSAIERDRVQRTTAARQLDTSDALLLVTSAVAILAIALAYSGRRQAFELAEMRRGEATPVIHLNGVTNAAALDPALRLVLPDAADRTFAGQHVLAFLQAQGTGNLANVGAILGISVPAAAIDSTPQLSVYAERLRAARERAATAGRPLPAAVPLFTNGDLVALKPSLAVRTLEDFRTGVATYALLYLATFAAVAFVWRSQRIRGDRFLLGTAYLLTAIGFAMLVSRSDPLRDSLLFVRYTEAVIVGCLAMAAVAFVKARKQWLPDLSYLPLLAAFVLSLLVILFGHGPGQSSAKVNLGPVQPIEAMRLLLALFLAGYFARRWELLRGVRADTIRRVRLPKWLDVPSVDYVIPVIAGVGTATLLFFLQRDLGPALLLACTFLAMYGVARGRASLAAVGLATLVAGFYVGYRLNISATLAERVRMWQSPWDNAVRGGDQVAQAIWALATGGASGLGLGLGDTRYLPAGHTDLVLAAIGEELGAIGVIAIAAAYVLLAWRGLKIARGAASDYEFFLATSLTLFLVVPALIMGAGVIGVIPLTGVVTPFLSYGGSAMTVNLVALGILSVIRTGEDAPARLEPFRIPMQWLTRGLAACALCLLVVFLKVQVVAADEYAVRAHLSQQGDGVRRYQYNPRLLDVVRQIPRGTVYDRRGLPLASDDRPVLQRAAADYTRMGVSIDTVCRNQGERCYPLEGKAFHLLGDSRSRVNWGASNTSYVERDAEDRLRGFDDHATVVQMHDASGTTSVVRRDYRDLLPLLRHRYDAGHHAVRTFMNRSRDLRLTIDARLQARVADILANAARRSATGRAAAAVIDTATGEVLALASYPRPSAAELSSGNVDDPEGGTLLDRARYGLYPPGSTFKLLTAAAALREGAAMSRTVFMCSRLPDGRIGARIPGRGRPIRDDVLDRHPHGAIGMHDGIVRSCNAYFAQLAVRLGPEALLDAAAPFGITLAPGNSRARLRDTLPQAGYGQGDVLTTPLRMARVAAAFASDGVIRDTRLLPAAPGSARASASSREREALLAPASARLIARYLRDAVLEGTGRALKDHPWRIAGKTGTAELADAPSHAWFAGFAPYGRATKRIALAVVIEHAGYGGLAAAPAAGEIVTAAAAAGLVQ